MQTLAKSLYNFPIQLQSVISDWVWSKVSERFGCQPNAGHICMVLEGFKPIFSKAPFFQPVHKKFSEKIPHTLWVILFHWLIFPLRCANYGRKLFKVTLSVAKGVYA